MWSSLLFHDSDISKPPCLSVHQVHVFTICCINATFLLEILSGLTLHRLG